MGGICYSQHGASTLCFPQRHRIAEFAAVVAKGQNGNAVQKACRKGAAEKGTPQRHRIAGNAAVVASGQRGNAIQKACRKGAAEKGTPQRHRITEFAAVVAKGQATKQANRTDRNRRNKPKQAKSGNRVDRADRTGSSHPAISPGYLRSFEARRMVSTAPSMPTRSVLTTRSYSPMSVHWRPV